MEDSVTDPFHNQGFGSPRPQGWGDNAAPRNQETHPETADFEAAPPTQERPNSYANSEPQYSNPFAGNGGQTLQPEYGQPSEQQPGGAYPSGYAQSAPSGEEPGNGGKAVLIGVLILAVLLVIAALAYIVFFKSSGTDEAAPAQTSTAAEATGQAQESAAATTEEATASSEAPATTSTAKKRPEHPQLPNGAVPVNDAARNNEPAGNFNSVYRDSALTTAPFAAVVRDEYVKHYLETRELNATIDAYSPITKITYTMTCADNGEFVTCKGGNNAIVYIL